MLFEQQRSVSLILGSTDMRKSADSLVVCLAAIGRTNVMEGGFFVFCNRKQTIIKILFWDHNGFCLLQKKLEEGHFHWPQSTDEIKNISVRDLRWILDGLNLNDLQIKEDKKFSVIF